MENKAIIIYAQHVLDTIELAKERGDKFNAVPPLTATFNSYVNLYRRLTGKDLIVIEGKVQEA